MFTRTVALELALGSIPENNGLKVSHVLKKSAKIGASIALLKDNQISPPPPYHYSSYHPPTSTPAHMRKQLSRGKMKVVCLWLWEESGVHI